MNCPICDEYGKTYASKPLGVVKIRYCKCNGCGNRFRAFEEIDTNPIVRSHQKTPRFPLVDAENIACPDCKSTDLRHARKTTKGESVTHFYQCKSCNSKFGIDADASDPISVARKNAAEKLRMLCPKCDGKTHSRGKHVSNVTTNLYRKCQSCEHRFTVSIPQNGQTASSPLILEDEIDHPVMP